MTVYHFGVPVLLPTGESGIFGISADGGVLTLANAVTASNAMIAAIAADVNLKTHFPSSEVWGPCQVNQLDGTFHVVATAFGATSFTPSGGAAPMPPEDCIVLTLRTALAGPANRGRMYLPTPNAAALGTTGRLSATAVGHILTGMKAGLDALVSAGFTPVVISRTHGLAHNVTTIEIGDVVDTQRRRRNSLTETRQSAAV